MKIESARRLLGKPALHVLLALVFTGAFLFPMFAITGPRKTFWFLHGAWTLSALALFLISRGADEESTDEEARDGEGS